MTRGRSRNAAAIAADDVHTVADHYCGEEPLGPQRGEAEYTPPAGFVLRQPTDLNPGNVNFAPESS
jgi:hypothetical protein